MADLREVLRPISGLDAQAGEVVDVTGWRNAAALERQRYLGPVKEQRRTRSTTKEQ